MHVICRYRKSPSSFSVRAAPARPLGSGSSCRRRADKDLSNINREFDDIVTWLSENVLYNRMVAAGQLP